MINQLAARLRLLRREKKMTQKELAKAMKAQRVTYTHYELAKRTPDLDTIILLARYLDVSVDYLIGNTNFRQPLTKEFLSVVYESCDDELTAENVADQPPNTVEYK